MASKVYFMDDHASRIGESTPFKAAKLLRDAGISELFGKGDTVGIKVHMGEYGNSLNIRPQWIKAIVDEVKRLGGYPVIIESNLNLNGAGVARTDSITHKRTASAHGYNEQTLGCPIWLPEGLFEIEGVKCEVPHGVYLNHTFVSSQMLKCDAIIVVSHFKGHPQGVFGGAIKNVGIGMASCRGKATTHFMNHPKYGIKNAKINQDAAQQMMKYPHPNLIDFLCKTCPFDCYEVVDGELIKHDDRCRQCTLCFNPSYFSGLLNIPSDMPQTTPIAIADSASGIINKIGRDKFMFVNYAFDITPSCDCSDHHDRPMVPNIGTFVSRDPVAVDMACLEAAEALAAIPGSKADDWGLSEPNTERFTNCASMAQVSQWSQINAGVYNGLGSSEYVLIESEPLSDGEVKKWGFDYDFGNPIGYVYRDYFKKCNYDTEGVTASNEPRIPMTELHKRPAGKVGEMDIADDK